MDVLLPVIRGMNNIFISCITTSRFQCHHLDMGSVLYMAASIGEAFDAMAFCKVLLVKYTCESIDSVSAMLGQHVENHT